MTPPNPQATQVENSSANGQMARLSETYTRIVLQSIGKAQTILADLETCDDPVSGIREIFAIVHDMKGQGATFGYDLVTDIGALACHSIRGLTGLTQAQRHALTQALTAARMIVEEKVTGTGGESGQDLLEALRRLFEQP